MLNFVGIISILAGLILVSLSSFGLVARGQFKGIVANILAFAIVSYATIVFLAQFLSEIYLVQRLGFLIGHGVIALLVLPWNIKEYRSGLRAVLATLPRYKISRKQLYEKPALTLLGLFVLASMLLGAYLIIMVPPNIYDSLSYHLPRVAYWLQNGTLHHFQTPDPIKIVHQGYNSEIGLLWLTALWGTDQLTGFMQWFAVILTTVAIYGLARQLDFSKPASLFAALIWNTFTIVVLQATSTKNDILVAFFVIAAFYFLRHGLQDTRRTYSPNLILFGLAFGLALGTKSMVILIAPGLALGCAYLLFSNPPRFWPRLLYGAVWCVLGFVFFGSYNYALNLINYRFFFGLTNVHTVQNPSFSTFASNLARIIYHFFDPGGLPEIVIDYVQQWRPPAGQKLFSLLNIAPNLPQANMDTFQFDATRPIMPREDAAWYGPLGFLLFLPALFFYLVISPLIEKNFWRWFTALVSGLYIIGFAILVRWQLHMGRLFLVSVVLGAPLMAAFYLWSERYKIVRWIVLFIALIVLSWSATHNFHKSIFGENNIWNLDYYELRTIQNPKLAPAHRYIDAQIPEEASLGLVGDEAFVRWDYLFFGPRLKRKITYLGPSLARIETKTFTGPDIDYLILGLYSLDQVDSQAPLWPIVEEGGLKWFLVKRSEIELFGAQSAQPVAYQQTFGADYQAYLEIKTILDQEPQPLRVLTTDPRMSYYDLDQSFVFGLPGDLGDLTGFTHLIVAPWWSAEDYERLDLSLEEVQFFLAQEQFVEKMADVHGYTLYRLLF